MRSSCSTHVTLVVIGSSAESREAAQTAVHAGAIAAIPNTAYRFVIRDAPEASTSTAATWAARSSQTINAGSTGG